MRSLKEWISLFFKNDKNPKAVLVRVDAGRTFGLSFGHVSRCIMIAGVLQKEYGSEIMFLMRDFPDGINHVGRYGYKVKKLPVPPGREERESIMVAIKEYQPDMMIIDVPYKNIDTSYFSKLRKQGINIVFIDDTRFIYPDVNVLLNSNILAPERMQKIINQKHKNTRFLLGIDYFIFDDSLLDKTSKSKNVACNILVTLGGSDPTSLTPKVLSVLLQEEWTSKSFCVVIGPGYPAPNEIKTLIGRRNNYQVVVNPLNLIPFLQSCDFAICAGGRTMYELLYLKKKFLPIATSEHEAELVEEFIRRGIIKAGLTNWEPNAFISNIKDLLLDCSDFQK